MYEAMYEDEITACVVNKIHGHLHANKYNFVSTPIIFNPVNMHFAANKNQQDVLLMIDGKSLGFVKTILDISNRKF